MIIFQIGLQSFKEIYRSKILFNTLFIGLILLVATFIVAEFSYGVADKVTLDIGLGLLSLSGVIIALFLGAKLLQSEIESRTLYMILSRPVSRVEFLFGKLCGLAGILLVNILVLFLMLTVFYYGMGGSYNSLIYWSVFFIYVESLLVMLMVVFFSLTSNTVISLLMTLTLFVAGHGIQTVKETHLYQKDFLLKSFVDFYTQWLPNFNIINIKSFVLYDKFLETGWLIKASTYSLCWCGVFLAFSILLFNKKELT